MHPRIKNSIEHLNFGGIIMLVFTLLFYYLFIISGNIRLSWLSFIIGGSIAEFAIFLKEWYDCEKINPTGWSWKDVKWGNIGIFIYGWISYFIMILYWNLK